MRRVIMESPYAGEVKANEEYARACLRDCLERGEAPLASHLLYTQPGVLDDNVPTERAWGIAASIEWRHAAEAGVFYIDRGWSTGMLAAKDLYLQDGVPIEVRSIADALGLQWEDTREVSLDLTMRMGRGYDWGGWEHLREEAQGPDGRYAVWPSGGRWWAYGGPDGQWWSEGFDTREAAKVTVALHCKDKELSF